MDDETSPLSNLHMVERHLTSRLLYPNPVCILSSVSLENKINLMTCSWLTPIDNMGRFFLSIKKTRYTAKNLLERAINERIFGINVCTDSLQDLVLKIGSCSGSSGIDKIKAYNIPICNFGWNLIDKGNINKILNVKQNLLQKDYSECNTKEQRKKIGWLGFHTLKFLQNSPVHLICRVTFVANSENVKHAHIEEDTAHYKLFCEILYACTDGKVFNSNIYNKNANLLTFFGSKTFGKMVTCDELTVC